MVERDGERADWLARHSLARHSLSLQRAARRLLGSARRDQAPDDLAERLLERLAERAASEGASGTASSLLGSGSEWLGSEPLGSPVVAADALALPARGLRRGLGAGAALLALGLAALVLHRYASQAPLPVQAAQNDRAASRGAVREAPRPTREATPSGAANGLCERAEQAQLQRPLIDDFEDNNTRIAAYDGRSGYWQLITADDPLEQKPRLLVPERVAQGSGTSNALHVKLGSVAGWGASLSVRLGPPCYDLSAFRGIRFRAKGAARVTVHVQMPEVIPRKFGGLCESECYMDHSRPYSLSASFEAYEISFDDLRRGKPPSGRGDLRFDPRRVYGLAFTVNAADTPAEYWLDDVALIP